VAGGDAPVNLAEGDAPVNLTELVVQMKSEGQALNDQITTLEATLAQLQDRRDKLNADITAIENYLVSTGGVLP
jgi:hypothetical protein